MRKSQEVVVDRVQQDRFIRESQQLKQCCSRKRKKLGDFQSSSICTGHVCEAGICGYCMRQDVAREGQLLCEGVLSLVGALASQNSDAQEFSLLALVVLATQGGCEVKGLIAEAGAFGHLLEILRSSPSFPAKESAAAAIAKLVSQHPGNRVAALRAGALKGLVNVTRFSGACGTMKARIQAAALIAVLSLCEAALDSRTPSVTDAFAHLAALLESEDMTEVAAGAGGLQALSSSLGKRVCQAFPLELVLALVHMSKCMYEEARQAAMEELSDLRDASCKLNIDALKRHGVQLLFSFVEKSRCSSAMEELVVAVFSTSLGSNLHVFFEESFVVPRLMRLVARGGSLMTRTFAMAGVAKFAARRRRLEALTSSDLSLILNALASEEPQPGSIGTFFREHAAAALVYTSLSGDRKRDEIVTSGFIPILVKLLHTGFSITCEYAIMALIVLADNRATASEKIVHAGGVKVLLSILTSSGIGVKFGATWNEMAAASLLTMAGSSAVAKNQIMHENAVFVLLHVLRGESSVKKASHTGVAAMVQLLGILAAGNISVKMSMVRAGAIRCVLELLACNSRLVSGISGGLVEAAAFALANLTVDFSERSESPVKAGAISFLSSFLEDHHEMFDTVPVSNALRMLRSKFARRFARRC